LDIAFLKSKKGTSEKDNKSFVFSIDTKKIYNNTGDYHINNGSDVINLYDQQICIVDNFLSNNYSYTSKTTARSFSGFEKDYELNNYEQYFTVEELEVFQID
jgi:hypothetical protein